MHTVHHTEAIILKSLPSGEANKRVWLLTREFGLVVALAQGLRKPEAKLKNQIIDYAIVSADLVRGKDTWRLISAVIIESPLSNNVDHPLVRPFVRSLNAIERFMAGEGVQSALFDHVIDFTKAMSSVDREVVDSVTYDTVSLWKILALFGYIAIAPDEEILYRSSLQVATSMVDKRMRTKLITKVQQAITESHL